MRLTPEGRTQQFLVGVNYWPRRLAMYMWARFDKQEVADEFADIAARGLRLVRFFLRWEDFQPEPAVLDRRARDNFLEVLDVAAQHGLLCMPTLFTGHMSGVNWLPEWTLDSARPATRFRTINARGVRPYGIGNFYEGDLLDAQIRFATAAGEWAAGHPALYAWDLGNEFSNLRPAATPQAAAEWSKRLTDALVRAGGAAVTGGLHGEDLSEDRGIRPSSIAAPWRFATMHGYPAYSAFARSPGDESVVPFLDRVTAAFTARDVLFTEFGTPPPKAGAITGLSEADAARYAQAVLERLLRSGALGACWWCYADYVPALAALPPFDQAPHELSFGLVRDDGSDKPVAAVLSHFARAAYTVEPPPPPLPVDEDAYYAGLPSTLESAYRAYVGAAASG